MHAGENPRHRSNGARPSRDYLTIEGVTKAFGDTKSLVGVDLRVAKGEIHALLGSNGSGKSTLIKILAGVYQADAGTLNMPSGEIDLTAHLPSDVRASGLHFVHQEPSVFPSLSVAENLQLQRDAGRNPLASVRRSALHERTRATLERFGVDAEPETLMLDLAPAARTTLMIARTLQDDEDSRDRILILDEPTATLEAADVRMLFDALRRYAAAGQTIIFVSHHLDEVMNLADRATVFRDGRNAGTLRREEFTESALSELIVGRPLATYFPSPGVRGDENPVLRASGLCGNCVDGVDLSVYAGEIVGLAGLVGSGHTELLRQIFGIENLEAGEVSVDGEALRLGAPHLAIAAGLAYIPADRYADGIFPDLSLEENLGIVSLHRYRRAFGLSRRAERAEASRDLERFGVVASSPAALVSSLSGGNQQKVIVARWLRRTPRILLLEDPTRGIDIGARSDLWTLIDQAVDEGAGVLMTSSDPEELARVCNRILVLHSGRITHELDGSSTSADDVTELIHRPTPVAA